MTFVASLISHDCDLANDAEAAVEVIVAETVVRGPRPDPQFTYAKNPRRLHLPYIMGPDAEPLVLELQHQQKRILPRPDFLGGAVRDQAAALVSEAKRVLKQWLAARYGRPALPDTLQATSTSPVRILRRYFGTHTQ